MTLPAGVTKIGNIRGPQGIPGTFGGATVTMIPAGEAPSVTIRTVDGVSYADFFIPRGLPGVNAVPADNAVATYATGSGTALNTALKSFLLPRAETDATVAALASNMSSALRAALQAAFELKGTAYTKGESDSRFPLKTDVYTKTQADGRYAPKPVQQVDLWIGDSFVEGYQSSAPAKRFTAIVSAADGATEANYAVGGSGVVAPGGGRTFAQQITAAKADNVAATRIFIAGGQNDNGNNETAVKAGLTATLNAAKTNYPGVPIYVIPMLWKASLIPDWARNIYRWWVDVVQGKNGVFVIDHAMEWLYGQSSLIAGDNTHPNDAGYEQIASFVREGLTGGDTSLKGMQMGFLAGTAMFPDNTVVRVGGGTASIVGYVNKLSGGSPVPVAFGDQVLRLDATGSRPSYERFLTGYTDGGNVPILLKLNTDGWLSVAAIPSGVTSNNVIIPPQSWPVGA